MQLSSLITPSPAWLSACRTHLGPNTNDESIWNQILHADLRDVVDQSTHGSSANGDAANPAGGPTSTRSDGATAAMALRKAIATSKQQGKAVVELTAMMVQTEEIVDCSLNAEGTLGGGDGNTHGPNQNNGQISRGTKNRMLKMVLSDGYTVVIPGSSGSNKNGANNSTMLAIETSSVPSLSGTTPPGTKLLLFSKIVIRHGMIVLTPHNCLVLGGKIEPWVKFAEEKKERERRMKGCGVDATVRALIWVNEDNLDEVDEGEGESRDVTTPRQQPTNTAVPPSGSSVFASNNNTNGQSVIRSANGNGNNTNTPVNGIAPICSSQNQNHNPNPSNSNIVSQTMSSSKNPYQQSASRSSGSSNPYVRNSQSKNGKSNPYQQSNNSSCGNPYQQNGNAGSNNPYGQSGKSGDNPYQQSNNINPYHRNNAGIGVNSHASNNNPYQRSHNSQSMNIQANQYQSSYNASSNQEESKNGYGGSQGSHNSHTTNQQHNSSFQSCNSKCNQTCPVSNSHESTNNPPRVSDVSSNSAGSIRSACQGTHQHERLSNNTIPPSNPKETPASAKNTTAVNSSIQSINPTPNRGTKSFSFAELKDHLLQMSQNRGLYEANYGKTYIVPCKLKNTRNEKRVFNIVKDKKSKKSDRRYEFLFICHFQGPKLSDGPISCRLQSSLMEPFFNGYTPSDIRKLQKTEKERATGIVNDSSRAFLHEFSSLALIHMKLMYGPGEFFGKISSLGESWMESLEEPLLIVVDRKTG